MVLTCSDIVHKSKQTYYLFYKLLTGYASLSLTSIMDFNGSYTKSYNQTLPKVTSEFNITNLTSKSEVAGVFTDFYEMYKSTETSQLMSYKTVSYIFGVLIFLSNLTVVISSGLILTKGKSLLNYY